MVIGGVPLCFFGLAEVVRQCREPRPRQGAILAILSVALFHTQVSAWTFIRSGAGSPARSSTSRLPLLPVLREALEESLRVRRSVPPNPIAWIAWRFRGPEERRRNLKLPIAFDTQRL